jgi:AraC-like DNA-binding protein
MTATIASCRARTTFSVRSSDVGHIEVIEGEKASWRFRPHYHLGDEFVRVVSGRAVLRLIAKSILVETGTEIVIPAGNVHHFQAVDDGGWSFISVFRIAECAMPTADDTLQSRAIFQLAERTSLLTDIAAIAAACGVSAGYLSRVFRHKTGTTLHNFHTVMAIQRAKSLLRAGEKVVEAALDAGFYDQAHLTREFVRTFGLTPGMFRSAWMNGDATIYRSQSGPPSRRLYS